MRPPLASRFSSYEYVEEELVEFGLLVDIWIVNTAVFRGAEAHHNVVSAAFFAQR